MTDDLGAVDAAAAETAAPATETPTPPEPVAPEETSRNAVERAFDAWDDAESGRADGGDEDEAADSKSDSKPEGPKRGSDGKFESADPEKAKAAAEAKDKAEKEAEKAADAEKKPADGDKAEEAAAKPEKPAAPVRDAPQRFSPEAKEAWKDAPEVIRNEVERAVGEMEKGLSAYQQRFEQLKPAEQYAQKHGRELNQMLAEMAAVNDRLNTDFEGGIRELAKTFNVDLEEFAFRLLDGGPGDGQRAPQNDAAQAEIATLKQQLAQVQQHIAGQQHSTMAQQVNAFAAERPRFDELSPMIARLMQTGMVARGDLEGAYQMAERLNPAPAPAPEPTPALAPAPAPAAQTRPRPVSISGSSGTGSDPARKKPAGSATEAFERAFSDL